MQPRFRLAALITLAVLSIAAMAWVWATQHEVLWPAIVGTLPLLKKLLTWKTLLALAKKVPWFFAAGLKKYVLKVVGSLTTVHIGLRFPWVRAQVDAIKAHATVLLTRVRDHWQTCSLLEKCLIVVFSTMLALLAIALILLSKSVQLLTLRKGSETTAEQLIKRGVPKAVDSKLKKLTGQPDAPSTSERHDSSDGR
ncbi:MAG: hypothetical protein AAF460_10065 [Pseudomonadota bacterium]